MRNAFFVCFSAACLMMAMHGKGIAMDIANAEPNNLDLNSRGVSYIKSGANNLNQLVGNLSILLINNGIARQISSSYKFKSGNQFKFKISANKEGYVYIFHESKSAGGKMLWPDDDSVEMGNNHIKAGKQILFPPGNDSFVFDKSSENEWFYIAISQQKKVPTWDVLKNEAIMANEIILNPGRKEGESVLSKALERNIRYKPGNEIDEANLASISRRKKITVYKFLLQHH